MRRDIPHEKLGRCTSSGANYQTTNRRKRKERERERGRGGERDAAGFAREMTVSSVRSFLIPRAIRDNSPWRVMKVEESQNSIFRSRSIYLFSPRVRFLLPCYSTVACWGLVARLIWSWWMKKREPLSQRLDSLIFRDCALIYTILLIYARRRARISRRKETISCTTRARDINWTYVYILSCFYDFLSIGEMQFYRTGIVGIGFRIPCTFACALVTILDKLNTYERRGVLRNAP